TAKAGSDYSTTFGALTFAAGETSKTFTVAILDDTLIEGNETFKLTLSSPTGGAHLGSSAATVTITDFEEGLLRLDRSTNTVAENGGTATFTVQRLNSSDGTVTVQFATSNGTATAGSDYVATTGMLTFAPGETSKSFAVTSLDDTLVEGDETLQVSLSN